MQPGVRIDFPDKFKWFTLLRPILDMVESINREKYSIVWPRKVDGAIVDYRGKYIDFS